ncbi:hypothetical protein EK21DRAFT_110797 [Setomelanomma holmii]|uniref:Uncharacterized protein n=1 Tax=Setomelanomma holmii TaxID=210430 RepID=A0A9P4HBM4_9PLEO|nr:hypothetical protein EK21DRAFT_110797 [Setomelanomma holmii]
MGALRTIPLGLAQNVTHFKLMIDKAYQFVHAGCPVEFGVPINRKKRSREERLEPEELKALQWIQEHFPHVRPDFIFKSMPEGSIWSIEPVADGRKLQFVVAKTSSFDLNPANYTRRLSKVKSSVEAFIAKGTIALRQKLSKGEHPERYPGAGRSERDYSNRKWDASPTSPSRYLPTESKSDTRRLRDSTVPK